MEVLPIEDVDIIQNREELTHSDDDENDKRRVALYASNDKIENLSQLLMAKRDDIEKLKVTSEQRKEENQDCDNDYQLGEDVQIKLRDSKNYATIQAQNNQAAQQVERRLTAKHRREKVPEEDFVLHQYIGDRHSMPNCKEDDAETFIKMAKKRQSQPLNASIRSKHTIKSAHPYLQHNRADRLSERQSIKVIKEKRIKSPTANAKRISQQIENQIMGQEPRRTLQHLKETVYELDSFEGNSTPTSGGQEDKHLFNHTQ